MRKNKILSIILFTAICFTGCGKTQQNVQNNTVPQVKPSAEAQVQTDQTQASDETPVLMETNRPDTENYTLKEVVVMSRHNIRSPLSEKGSLLERMSSLFRLCSTVVPISSNLYIPSPKTPPTIILAQSQTFVAL